jgi:TonB family protein
MTRTLIGYSSAYLVHLDRVKEEEKERFLGVPPFFVLLGVAVILHLALMIPAYLWQSDPLPQTKQVHLAFGKKSEKAGGSGNTEGGDASVSSMGDAVANLDSMFQPPPQPTVQRPTTPSPMPPSLQDMPPVVAEGFPQTTSVSPGLPLRKMQVARHGTSNASVMPRSATGTEGTGGMGEGGSGGGEGNGGEGGNDASVRAVISRYEQLLSGWIDRHKIYPADALRQGLQGRVVVRLRVTRTGSVVMKSIERSSGHRALDQAVLETVTRSAPMPAVPSEYPGGEQLEFLIPISFTVK